MRVLASIVVLSVAFGMTVPAFALETTPQPLTRADCEKAGMQWNDNANVCGGKEGMAEEAKPKKKK
jgi:hypothetical protein